MIIRAQSNLDTMNKGTRAMPRIECKTVLSSKLHLVANSNPFTIFLSLSPDLLQKIIATKIREPAFACSQKCQKQQPFRLCFAFFRVNRSILLDSRAQRHFNN